MLTLGVLGLKITNHTKMLIKSVLFDTTNEIKIISRCEVQDELKYPIEWSREYLPYCGVIIGTTIALFIFNDTGKEES